MSYEQGRRSSKGESRECTCHKYWHQSKAAIQLTRLNTGRAIAYRRRETKESHTTYATMRVARPGAITPKTNLSHDASAKRMKKLLVQPIQI